MTLHIACPDYLATVRAFARAHGAEAALDDGLTLLAHYNEGASVCELHADFAPYSFRFLMRHLNGSIWFNGGLIYSGPGQPLDGSFPALTVSLEPTGPTHEWSIHT